MASKIPIIFSEAFLNIKDLSIIYLIELMTNYKLNQLYLSVGSSKLYAKIRQRVRKMYWREWRLSLGYWGWVWGFEIFLYFVIVINKELQPVWNGLFILLVSVKWIKSLITSLSEQKRVSMWHLIMKKVSRIQMKPCTEMIKYYCHISFLWRNYVNYKNNLHFFKKCTNN